MSAEKPSVGYLLELLKEAKKDGDYIIDVLQNIIHTKQLYGGDITDSINYQVEKVKKELNRI
ncbi:MAG: hypothetical protein EB127_03740 [Alphaproteobacteria bacterium]|nr:hypothetical protein [Alphaproteobacteria bacterium]